MDSTAINLIELGAVFFGLGVLGKLALRIGISPIPLYLLGGLAFGADGLVPLQGIGHFTELASEIGVVMLLLRHSDFRFHRRECHPPPGTAA